MIIEVIYCQVGSFFWNRIETL